MATAAEQRRMNGGMTDAEIDAHAEYMDALAGEISDEWRRRGVRTIFEYFAVVAELDPYWGNR